ncbi:sensor histidine kinase [Brevibacterium samyangense]|uniref:histidine kinase n=1 Tax=Brevibacterium samyangense TaxID=366888 RepID=A0ABN2TKX1_9MICO
MRKTTEFRSSSRLRRMLLLATPGLVVLLSIVATTVVAASVQFASIRESTLTRVHDVATSFAALESVRAALVRANADGTSTPPPVDDVQDLATLVERAAGVTYVVVVDLDEVRLTHPEPAERGRPVETDTSPLRTGQEYVGTDTGPVGRTLRVKVPVFGGDGEVIGMVAVGMLESQLTSRYEDTLRDLLPWEIGALAVGMLASGFLTFALVRRFRRSDEDARELEASRRTTMALREQSHEFDTRMHVVRGLLAHGDTADALDYLEEIAPLPGEAVSSPGHLPPLLRATLDALRAELGALGTSLDVSVDEGAGVTGFDSGAALVLANLCRNAAEAGAGRVRLVLSGDDGELAGSVDDDGPGVGAVEVGRIFERGFSTKRDRHTTVRGIGLDLVRRTVTAHGGTIEVGTSDLGGARFRFTMRTGVAPHVDA